MTKPRKQKQMNLEEEELWVNIARAGLSRGQSVGFACDEADIFIQRYRQSGDGRFNADLKSI